MDHVQSLKNELQKVTDSLETLHQEYATLVDSAAAREGSSDPAGGDGDQASVERGALVMRQRALEKRIVEITQALREVEEGTYGKCRKCESDIAPARLEALPGVSTCISCA